MKTVQTAALGAAVTGAMLIAGYASAVTLASFKTTPIVEDIFTFTYIDSTAGLDPTGPVAPGAPAPGDFPPIEATNLPDDIEVNVDIVDVGDAKIATLQLSNTADLTNLTETIFNLSYTVEMYAGDELENPGERLDTISIGVNISGQRTNASGQKWIFGQNTALITDATFKDLMEDGEGAVAPRTATCGICRMFVVTDIIDTNPAGLGQKGIISSITNDFTVNAVPVPMPLALFGAGLVGLGVVRRFNKRA
jgi:hypothetical protein